MPLGLVAMVLPKTLGVVKPGLAGVHCFVSGLGFMATVLTKALAAA
jgi:hypothetical protein